VPLFLDAADANDDGLVEDARLRLELLGEDKEKALAHRSADDHGPVRVINPKNIILLFMMEEYSD
jgi:hypothetical protein